MCSGKFQDLTGKRFGKLVVIERILNIRPVRWKCKCDCGNSHEVTSESLKNGDCKSCGCFRSWNSKFNNPNRKHNLRNHPLYRIWHGIKNRCLNSNEPGYKFYGAKGIKICDEWKNDIKAFYLWSIENGWKKGLTIDRINSKGNYEPSNCQFLTRKENSEKMQKEKC